MPSHSWRVSVEYDVQPATVKLTHKPCQHLHLQRTVILNIKEYAPISHDSLTHMSVFRLATGRQSGCWHTSDPSHRLFRSGALMASFKLDKGSNRVWRFILPQLAPIFSQAQIGHCYVAVAIIITLTTLSPFHPNLLAFYVERTSRRYALVLPSL